MAIQCSSVLHAIQLQNIPMVTLPMLNRLGHNKDKTIFLLHIQPLRSLTISIRARMLVARKTSSNLNYRRTMKTQMILIQTLFMYLEWSFWHLLRRQKEADILSITTIERQISTLVNKLKIDGLWSEVTQTYKDS